MMKKLLVMLGLVWSAETITLSEKYMNFFKISRLFHGMLIFL